MPRQFSNQVHIGSSKEGIIQGEAAGYRLKLSSEPFDFAPCNLMRYVPVDIE